MSNPLYNHINSRIEISTEDFQPISDQLKEVHFSKNDIIIRPGQQAAFKFFVVKGCLRSFFIDSNGKDCTLQFAIENWWIADFTSYFGGGKSLLFVECLEDCVLYKVDKETWEPLFRTVPQLETYTRMNLEIGLVSTQKNSIKNLSLSAQERYTNFCLSFPDIEKRIKNYHIASYLGITPESLSRVRKELLKN